MYASQREAMKDAQLVSTGAICNAIKNGTPSYGHLHKWWTDCTPELRETFIKENGNPEVPKTTGIRVQRMQPITNNVEETYDTIEFVVKQFQVGRATLKTAIEQQKTCKGWLWRYV